MLNRATLAALFLPLLGISSSQSKDENWCKDKSTVTVSGIIEHVDITAYYVAEGAITTPCQISGIKFKQQDKACKKGVKFTATGVVTVEYDEEFSDIEDDDRSLVYVNLGSIECRP